MGWSLIDLLRNLTGRTSEPSSTLRVLPVLQPAQLVTEGRQQLSEAPGPLRLGFGLRPGLCLVAWGLDEAARRVALLWHPENKPRQMRCSDYRPMRVGDVGEAPGSLGTADADSIVPAGRRPRQRLVDQR